MAPEWEASFEAFFLEVGSRPSKQHWIERIQNNKGYEPGNVRWATRKEQARNRRSNVVIEYEGKSKTLVEWSEELGIDYKLLHSRIRLGWTPPRLFKEKR